MKYVLGQELFNITMTRKVKLVPQDLCLEYLVQNSIGQILLKLMNKLNESTTPSISKMERYVI